MKHFVCAQCGACCRWQGYVRAVEEEMPAIAAHLGISQDELIDKYTKLAEDRKGLVYTEHEDGSCIFLDSAGRCSINPVKPYQCSSFPYDWTAPDEMMKLCKGHWEETRQNNSGIAMVHVLGHPNLPLDVPGAPSDAQVFNCHNFCHLLSFLGIPFIYYGAPGSAVPAPGRFVSTGKPTGSWKYRNGWHNLYNARLSKALAKNLLQDGTPQIIASMYGAAQSDIDTADLPVVEPMVGYDHCWAPYRIFPSYCQQSVIYTRQQESTWNTRWFDTVIPHFLQPNDYWISPTPKDYLLYLGRNAEDKGISIAKQCAKDTGLELRIEHSGWTGKEKTELLANARAVLMPTMYLEPFGYVAIEAQMCGTPVITTDWGAFPETVIQGKTGFRCRTAAEFAKAAIMAPHLNRQDIRNSAKLRFSLTAVAPLFERYLSFVWKIHKNGGYYSVDAFHSDFPWNDSDYNL